MSPLSFLRNVPSDCQSSLSEDPQSRLPGRNLDDPRLARFRFGKRTLRDVGHDVVRVDHVRDHRSLLKHLFRRVRKKEKPAGICRKLQQEVLSFLERLFAFPVSADELRVR